jgi:hypothetical protein
VIEQEERPMLEIRIATTSEEREAVSRFRYSVYVEEIGRYQSTADHARRRLCDPEDEHSWIIYAHDGTEVVGSMRLTWGGDGFSERQIDQYGLAPFLDEIPGTMLAVGERTMISPAWRGVDLFSEMGAGGRRLTEDHDVRIVFGACEPHLLSFYCRVQRPFGEKNINSEEAGYLIPLVSFTRGPEALVGLGREPDGMPDCVQKVLDSTGTVSNALLRGCDTYSKELHTWLAALATSAFDGLTDTEIDGCAERSSVITCRAGDRLIKKDGVGRNVFIVLKGSLEARDGERVVGILRPGDVVGEGAFVLQSRRGLNVFVVEDGTKVLNLSERTLRANAAHNARVGATLFENIAKTLCSRLALANAHGRADSALARG